MNATGVDIVALVVIGVIALAFVLAALRAARRARAARAWLDQHGVRAEGEVLRVWQENHGLYRVRYRFTPAGASEPIQRDEYAGCLAVTVPEVGDRVRVRYDPADPAHALLVHER
jgi:hypothetical protein